MLRGFWSGLQLTKMASGCDCRAAIVILSCGACDCETGYTIFCIAIGHVVRAISSSTEGCGGESGSEFFIAGCSVLNLLLTILILRGLTDGVINE